MNKENLLKIEKGFWHEGADYYNKYVYKDAMFVFPDIVLGKKDGVEAAGQAPRWETLDLTNEKIIKLSDEVVLLTYHAKGKREGQKPYTGNITTIYKLENGEPKMVFHQHTPDSKEE